MSEIKVSKKQIPQHLLAAFPEYKGRKFKIEPAVEYYCNAYWSGGTKYDFVLVNLSTGEQKQHNFEVTNPFNRIAHSSFNIPEGWCVVEHIRFCGKDLGLRFYVHPNNMSNMYLK